MQQVVEIGIKGSTVSSFAPSRLISASSQPFALAETEPFWFRNQAHVKDEVLNSVGLEWTISTGRRASERLAVWCAVSKVLRCPK